MLGFHSSQNRYPERATAGPFDWTAGFPDEQTRSMYTQTRQEIIRELLRSLKPDILTIWISLLDVWTRFQALPRQTVRESNLSGLLDDIFLLLEHFGENPRGSGLPQFRGGNIVMREWVNCELHEPLCLGLYHTCLRAFGSVIDVIRPWKLNGRDLDENELERLFEIAAREAIHIEINVCDHRCAGSKCPFAESRRSK